MTCAQCNAEITGEHYVYGIPGKAACTLVCMPVEYVHTSFIKADVCGRRVDFTEDENAEIAVVRKLNS